MVDTYELPNPQSKLSDIEQRLQRQHEMLMPIIAKLGGALNGRVSAQRNGLKKIDSKLIRSLNGRIKAQAQALQPIANSLYSALESRIADQGRSLDMQAAVLSRLGQPASIQPISPTLQPGTSIFAPSLGANAVAPSITPTVTSLPAGMEQPPFSLIPGEVIPPNIPPLTQPSMQSMGGFGWAALVNCNARTIGVYDLSLKETVSMVANGAFVPVRYSPIRSEIEDNFLGLPSVINDQRTSMIIGIACHARDNGGDGWPDNGDFPSLIDGSATSGYPVGGWPFDKNGNYIGL